MRSYENGASSAEAFSISSSAAVGGADFGDRSAHGRRQLDAARDRALRLAAARGDDVDKIGVDQERRIFEDGKRDGRLVERQRLHDGGRRLEAACKHLGHRLAHQRRGVVEQHQQRPFGGGTVILGQIGNQPGPRQARVASARSPAGALLIQSMNCRTIMILPAYATPKAP